MISRGCAALLIAALTSCTLGDSGPLVLQQPPPAQPDAAYWSAVRKAVVDAGDAATRGQSSDGWLLPYTGVLREARVAPPGDRVDATVTRGFNLGFHLFPLLPLWADVRELRAEPGRATREMSSWSANPLWATSSHAPDADTFTDLWGVPLIYWGGREVAADRSTSIHGGLWTLGPLYASSRNEATGEGYRIFMPAAAAGLGPLVWISIERHDAQEHVVGHGPAGLVWLESSTRVEHAMPLAFMDAQARGIERGRLLAVLGGALWTEVEGFDASEQLVTSRYGPLWTALGWGRRDGESVVYLFGVPIPW